MSLPCKKSCLLQTTEKNAYIIVTMHSQIKQCFLSSLFRQRPKHTNSAHASKNIKMGKCSLICLSTELNLVRFNVLCRKKRQNHSVKHPSVYANSLQVSKIPTFPERATEDISALSGSYCRVAMYWLSRDTGKRNMTVVVHLDFYRDVKADRNGARLPGFSWETSCRWQTPYVYTEPT